MANYSWVFHVEKAINVKPRLRLFFSDNQTICLNIFERQVSNFASTGEIVGSNPITFCGMVTPDSKAD